MARGQNEVIQYYIRKGEHEDGDRIKASSYFDSLKKGKDNAGCKFYIRELERDDRFVQQLIVLDRGNVTSEEQSILNKRFKAHI